MSIDDLIRAHGDELRAMDHERYAALALELCGDHPATQSAIRNAQVTPQRRFTNIVRDRILRHLAGQAVAPVGRLAGAGPSTRRTLESRLWGRQPQPPVQQSIDREPGDECEVDMHGLALV